MVPPRRSVQLRQASLPTMSARYTQPKAETAKHTQILKDMLKQPDNKARPSSSNNPRRRLTYSASVVCGLQAKRPAVGLDEPGHVHVHSVSGRAGVTSGTALTSAMQVLGHSSRPRSPHHEEYVPFGKVGAQEADRRSSPPAVKSVDLDTWSPEQIAVRSVPSTSTHAPRLTGPLSQMIQRWGNRRANLYWEAHLKPGHIPPEQ